MYYCQSSDNLDILVGPIVISYLKTYVLYRVVTQLENSGKMKYRYAENLENQENIVKYLENSGQVMSFMPKSRDFLNTI